MKNKKQFDWAVGVLVKAYLEGTLKHRNACACAVGNLVANSLGYKVDVDKHNE